ncbi:unnamed protein product [Symbiodinium sp. KB8]|nr:unnamed protein product [Symbiodinium sp. KB8]
MRCLSEHCEVRPADQLQTGAALWTPLPLHHKVSTFFNSETVLQTAVPQRRTLRTEGFSGWFPNPDEKRVEPPEGQEAMAIQEAEKEEEHEEDPMSKALDRAGDAVAGDAEKTLEKMKDDVANSLEASKDDGGGNAAAEAAKEEEDTGDPPDVDDELPGPFYTRAWFLGLVLAAFVGVTSYTVLQVRAASDSKGSDEDELERTYAYPSDPINVGFPTMLSNKLIRLGDSRAAAPWVFEGIESRLTMQTVANSISECYIVAGHASVLAQQQEQKALLQQRAATACSEGDGTPAAKGGSRSTPGAPCAQWPQVQIPPPSGRHPAVQQQSNLLQLPPLLHSLPARTQPSACNRLPQPPVSQKTQEKGRPLMEPPSEEAEYEVASEEKREEAERSETTVAPEASPEVQAEASDASPEAKENPEADKESKEDQTEQESSTKHAEEKNSFVEVESVTENPVKEELRTEPESLEAPRGPGRTGRSRALRRPERPVRRGKAGPRHSEAEALPEEVFPREERAPQWKLRGKMSMRTSGAQTQSGSGKGSAKSTTSTGPTAWKWRPTVPQSER